MEYKTPLRIFLIRRVTKESIIDQTYSSENLPFPLFAKEGEFLPFVTSPESHLPKSSYRNLVWSSIEINQGFFQKISWCVFPLSPRKRNEGGEETN
jgi:hypothetical protein